MKKTIYIAALLLGTATAAVAQAQENLLEEIKVTDSRVKKSGREVNVGMTIDLTGVDMKRQQSLRLTPVVVSNDGEQELEMAPVVVDGKIRNRVHNRQKALTGEAPTDGAYTVVSRRNGDAQQVEYTATLPYEAWMGESRLVLRGEGTGCLECPYGDGEATLKAPFLQLFRPSYLTPFVQPPSEPVKRRDVVRVARIQFRQDSYKIKPDYKNNRAELDTVTHSIAVVKDDPDLTITGIYITGYASPEATVAYNKRLSQNRADALARYAQQDTHVDASLWHVVGMGEDWEGLREEVLKHPRLLKIDQVLKIIDECDGNQDACEERLKALVPPTIYKRLLNEMYGPLRRNEYRIEYNVRNFSLEEARREIKNRPELLSVAEMYAVADSYGKGTPEYAEALLTAARVRPDNVSAVVNAACLRMEQGETEEAVRLLEASQVKEAPEALNALGVALARLEQYDRACEVLERAARAGSSEAEHNLKQVAGVMADL